MVIVQVQIEENVCPEPNACQVRSFMAVGTDYTEAEGAAAGTVLKHVGWLIEERERSCGERTQKAADDGSPLN